MFCIQNLRKWNLVLPKQSCACMQLAQAFYSLFKLLSQFIKLLSLLNSALCFLCVLQARQDLRSLFHEHSHFSCGCNPAIACGISPKRALMASASALGSTPLNCSSRVRA